MHIYINNVYLCRFEKKSFFDIYWQLHLNVFTWVLNFSPGSALSNYFYWICFTQQLLLDLL